MQLQYSAHNKATISYTHACICNLSYHSSHPQPFATMTTRKWRIRRKRYEGVCPEPSIALYNYSEPLHSKINQLELGRLVYQVEYTTNKHLKGIILAPYMTNSWPHPTWSLCWIMLCPCKIFFQRNLFLSISDFVGFFLAFPFLFFPFGFGGLDFHFHYIFLRGRGVISLCRNVTCQWTPCLGEIAA